MVDVRLRRQEAIASLGGSIVSGGCGLAQRIVFVVDKEEKFVALDGAAEIAAEAVGIVAGMRRRVLHRR